MSITLPAVVNGQIMPGRRGPLSVSGPQRAATGRRRRGARDLIPYLPDAVPGWFQATLALYDAKGKELAYDDDYRFHPDPVLHYEIPKDGDYVIEIKDAIYRGREDFVYRITLGELPFVTSIFPLGGPAGAQTTVELKGWNLPVTSLTRTNGEAGRLSACRCARKTRISNRVPFAVDTLPEASNRNRTTRLPPPSRSPCPSSSTGALINRATGTCSASRAAPAMTIVAEVYARRLDSPLDSVLKLTDAAGKQLAFNDDHEDKAPG